MLINILSTVDNESNTMVVKQVSSPPSHTVEKHSSDDSPIVERTPSPTAEEPFSDGTHTVEETPSPTVEQQCSDGTHTVSATCKKRKRKQLNVTVSVISIIIICLHIFLPFMFKHVFLCIYSSLAKVLKTMHQNIRRETM